MQQTVSIFLGANSASGFYSLYSQLLSGRFDDLLILKGGPGCGKSTFMRTLAQELAPVVPQQIHVPCSGDPDSLDAVLFPTLRAAVVDGTSPHALEPTYAVACERVVDLTQFYDIARTKEKRAEIMLLTDSYRACYRDAYRALRACGEVSRQRCGIACAGADQDKLARRAAGILSRELREGKGNGKADEAFLGGLTHKGDVCLFDTVTALCPRVYELYDPYGLAAALLSAALERAAACGERALACRDADDPKRLRHLLIPSRGLAFVTADERTPFPGKSYRRIRFDTMAEQNLSRAQKARLRFLRHVEQTLRDEAQQRLHDAKSTHDALEETCHPFVDFAAVTALAQKEADRLRAAAF